jgi:NTE family protein
LGGHYRELSFPYSPSKINVVANHSVWQFMTRKKVGLALSGGGARGFAHIGVLKALAQFDIRVDMIAGTSAGSIVGGAYAAGMSIDELITMASRVRWTNMIRPSLSTLGLFSTAPMGRFIVREFPVQRFEQLTIPFAAVACDFATGGERVFTGEGDLAFAIRASCAVPGVFAPVKDFDGKLLIDGGVVSPTPTDAVRSLGADIVIAVDLMACGATFRTHPYSAFGMLFQSAMMLLRTASVTHHYRADVVVIPQIAHLRPDQIGKRDEFIAFGEAAGRDTIDAIRKLVDKS